MATGFYLPGGSKLELPPCQRVRVELRLLRPAQFRFLHGGILQGLLCRVFGHPLPATLFPFTAESGRIFYPQGEVWTFVLTAIGDSRARLPELRPALEKLGALKPLSGEGPPPTLDGNFEVLRIEGLDGPTQASVEARAGELAEAGVARLRFLSPLRLRLADEERGATARDEEGRSYVSGELFPPELFLDRALRRLLLLRDGEFPPARSLPPPPRPRLAASRLLWVDLPMRGPREKRPGRPQGTTLGGVLGEVELAEVTPEAAALLAALESFHAGSNTHYGFGRYALGPLTDAERPAPRRLDLAEAAEALLSGNPALRDLQPRQGHAAFERAQREGYRFVWRVDPEKLNKTLAHEITTRAADLFPADSLPKNHPAEVSAEGLRLLLPDLAAGAARAGAKLLQLGESWILFEREESKGVRKELREALGPLPIEWLLRS